MTTFCLKISFDLFFVFLKLHQERTEERRKLVKGKQDGSATDMQEKWKKLLGSALSSHKEQRKSSKISLISYKRKCEISKEIIFFKDLIKLVQL